MQGIQGWGLVLHKNNNRRKVKKNEKILESIIQNAKSQGGAHILHHGLDQLLHCDKLFDVNLFQINEAFAPQFLAVQKDLNLDMAKTNVNGGAIALGHPVGTSGARITGHLVREMKRQGIKHSIGSACIGGGQGIAVVLENMS